MPLCHCKFSAPDRSTRVLAALAIATLCSPANAAGPQYPTKPVRLVTAPAGGGVDVGARMIATPLTAALGQQVIIDNRGVIASDIVAKAPNDGHTLLYYGSTLWLLPFLRATTYDVLRDFQAITLTVSSPNILVVHPSVKATSVKELIALAASQPGKLNYASANSGSSNHLAAELFNSMAKVQIVRIPYKGGGPAMNDLLGGHVQLMFATASAVMLHARSGKLRALAVTSARPSPLAPGLPTVAESGLPGYESVANYGLFAPRGTAPTIVSTLYQKTAHILEDTREQFLNYGFEPVGGSPDQFTAVIKTEMKRMGKVIKDGGIRAD